MKFCTSCGSALTLVIPSGDNRCRYVCSACGNIHYENPKIVTGCLVESDDKILLCKRAIEPKFGLWTLPAGFLETNESVEEGAIRETLEETQAKVEITELFCVYSVPHVNQVYMLYRASLLTPEFAPTAESSEVLLVPYADIPWSALAFAVIETALRQYGQAKQLGKFTLIRGVIDKRIPQ